MSLHIYHEKRDFKKTREPRGRVAKKAKSREQSQQLSFVIQEHHASHLHYDFRLELDGVLKSWAVPKGPSFNPKDKRLAVEVEDHPLDYGTFSGTIPKGEYGAGEVYIWDNGYWEPVGDPHKALKAGRLEFKMHGQKMKGTWLLVRTRATSSGKNQWLLMKRKDPEATLAEDDSKASTVVSKKTARSAPNKWTGVAKKTTKKVAPKADKKIAPATALPDFIEPQLALLVDHAPEGDDWIHEIKFDGYRIEALLDFKSRPKVELKTRTQKNWTESFKPIAEALKKLKVENAILDGEVVVQDEKGRSDFQLLQNAIKDNNTHSLKYEVFDILFLNGQDLREKTLRERKDILKSLLKKTKDPIRYVEDMAVSGSDLLKASCQLELEGIISKQIDSTYQSNRSGIWTKSKCKQRQEFVIGGYTDPQGARAGFGALLLGVYQDNQLVYAGRVGTGFNEKSLSTLIKKLKTRERDTSPFAKKSPREKGLHWLKPDLVAEIEFANWTRDQVLRVPVFQGLREDKNPHDVKMEKPRDLDAVASKVTEGPSPSRSGIKKPLKKKSASTVKAASSSNQKAIKNIPISHPDKIIYKKEKITKGLVAAYYAEVAPLMLAAMADRPLSILRCPHGSTGTCFFQKHDPHSSADIQAVSISEKSGPKDYMTIESVKGLESLVQMGTIEIHPWNCRAPHIEYPDQIVMDFDPGEKVPWKQVVGAAFALKEILDQLKLKSFLKVTGGKGLHVHIPFAHVYSWEQIKSFSHTLATELTSRDPELYTTDMSKKIRDKKIFVDYLRNGRGATAVAPYSLRAKALSSVAMPIDWKELNKLESANGFTMEKALEKIKKRKSDPWADYYKISQKIKILKEA